MELTQAAQFVFMTFFAFFIFLANPIKENHIAKGDYYYQVFDNEAAQKEYEQAYKESPHRVTPPCFVWFVFTTTMEEFTCAEIPFLK